MLEGDDPGAGNLPSFFVATLGHLDRFCFPTPIKLPIFKKNMPIPGVSPGVGGGGEGEAGID